MRIKPYLLFIPAAVFLISFFWVYRQTAVNLLSPFLNEIAPPDLTSELSQRISNPPTLDYNSSQKLSNISDDVSYLVYNPHTGTVYAANNQTKKIAPASFTKLMTASVALDLAPINQLFSATEESINKEPTILGLKIGEQLSLTELIKAAIATSANDAASTLAEGISNLYGQKTKFFITQMNQKASLLNMKNTQFANPEGYDDQNQYSTLEDLSILIHNVQQNYPDIIAAGKSDRDDLSATTTHGFYYLPNWNTLLGLYPGVDGLKIAYTENAGYSTIITANRDKKPVILILSGAKTLKERDLIGSQLLDFAYSQERLAPINLTEKDLQTRYDVWNALARQIRAELEAQAAEE